MERLRQRELRALVDFLIDGERVEDLDAFVRHVLRGLPKLVSCASISYNEINTRRGRIEWVAEPDESTRFPGCEEILSRHIYPSQDSASLARVLNRDTTEFSDRERLLLNLLRPHIRRRYEQAEALTELRAQLALLSRGIEAAGAGLVVLGPDGRVVSTTEAAQGWLRRYLGWKDSSRHLPSPLAAWLAAHRADAAAPGEIPPPPAPFVTDVDGQTLSVRALREAAGHLLVLREITHHIDPARLRAQGLTAREAEVLGWVAEGKTNWKIAAILGLSPRTVHHHLEHVYAKLGVETRTAAARRAREIRDVEP